MSPSELAAHTRAADAAAAALEASRDLSHIWIHVDMDAFFAAGTRDTRTHLLTLLPAYLLASVTESPSIGPFIFSHAGAHSLPLPQSR